MTALILLAAGLSERFGTENKLLAELDGKPMVQHVMDAAKGINYEHRLAVTSDSSDIQNICKSNGYNIILNDTPERGQGRSISLGTKRAVDLGANSVCILLGDMPFIAAKHLEDLHELRAKSDRVFSINRGVRLPPAIFSGPALKQLVTLDSGHGAKSLFSSKDCVEIALPSHQAQDIDTQDALQELDVR